MKYFLVFITGSICSFLLICALFFGGSINVISDGIRFQTADGSFTYEAIPSKGRDYQTLEAAYTSYLENEGMERKALYRITKKNYLKIGKWAHYKLMPEWQYPYLPKWKRG